MLYKIGKHIVCDSTLYFTTRTRKFSFCCCCSLKKDMIGCLSIILTFYVWGKKHLVGNSKEYPNTLGHTWMDICMKSFCFFLIPVRYKLFVWKLLKFKFLLCTSIIAYPLTTHFLTPYVLKWIFKAQSHSWTPSPRFLKGVFEILKFSQKFFFLSFLF